MRLMVVFVFAYCWPALLMAQHNLLYGAEPEQEYDLYAPPGANDTCVLFIHAGGWGAGDKTDFGLAPAAVAAVNLWSATMNYRLGKTGHNYLDNINDVKQCIDSLQTHTGCTKIVLMGGSAGASIAMNYACQTKDPRVVFVVAFSGVYDFSKRNMEPKVYENGQRYCNYDHISGSPITYAADCPPVMLVHGYKDQTILCKQSIDMYKKLKSLDKKVQGFLLRQMEHTINPDQIPFVALKVIEQMRKH